MICTNKTTNKPHILIQRVSKVNAMLSTAKPRHQNLASTLASEIERGVYPVGSKLPREMDLCAQFGASRHTVRAALDRLVRSGLITRTPRLGTFVKANKVVRGYQLKLTQISDLTQFSAETQMEVLDRKLQTVSEQSEQELLPYAGQQWLFVRGLRHSSEYEVPISYHEVWIHPDYRAVSGVEGFIKRSIFDLVEQQFGVAATRVRQNIQSAVPTSSIEKLLKIEANTPCLWVRRQYFDQNSQMVELSISVHPGDLFSYQMDLERSGATSTTA